MTLFDEHCQSAIEALKMARELAPDEWERALLKSIIKDLHTLRHMASETERRRMEMPRS